jgi:hypothetical protein
MAPFMTVLEKSKMRSFVWLKGTSNSTQLLDDRFEAHREA